MWLDAISDKLIDDCRSATDDIHQLIAEAIEARLPKRVYRIEDDVLACPSFDFVGLCKTMKLDGIELTLTTDPMGQPYITIKPIQN